MQQKFDGVSENFKQFMFDLKDWIDNDFQNKDGQNFCKSDSICFQIGNWAKAYSKEYNEVYEDLHPRMEAGIPFNSCMDDYGEEVSQGDHYKNPKRLAWINETVAALKGENNGNS